MRAGRTVSLNDSLAFAVKLYANVTADIAKGLHEHLALLIAAVEVMYRFQIASSLYSTANNLSPKVIYLAGSEPLTSTFANEMRFLSEGHIEVGILGRKAAPSALNVQACKWDVLCTTPDKLFEAVDTNIVYLGQLQLLIADEASILQARHWQPTMRDIGRLLRQQQATSGPVHLHVASVFTHASQVSLRQQFKELSPHRIVFRNDSDAKRNVTLTFTVLPDEYATALRPQQTRNFTLSSLWKNRPVIVISPEESDLPQLTAEMRGWLSIDVLEKRVGSTQIICGDEMEQFAKGYSDVLAISLHPYNTGILAPRLQDFSREMCVCIYRLHEADNYRDSFDKW